MANLFNNDIGLNYKGLINIGATINQNISGSLQYLTDGDGNNLPIQVSTTTTQINYGVGIGVTPSSTIGLYVNGQAGTTGVAFTGASATMYIDLNGSGINFFDATQTRYRNFAGTTLAMNVWGNLGMVAIGGSATTPYTPSASLHLRGDGINSIFRVDNNSGTLLVGISNTGIIESNNGQINLNPGSSGIYFATNAIINTVANNGLFIRYGAHTGMLNGITLTSNADLPITATSGTARAVGIISTFAAGAGSANYRPLSITYTVNNTGAQTGNTTGIFLNAIETNLNGMTHALMDLQANGQSRVRYTNTSSTGLQITRVDNAYVSVSLNTNGITIHQNLGLVTNYITPTLGSQVYLTGGGLSVGVIAAAARLHVRGDGTNPIGRFENNAGTARMIINDNGRINMAALPTSSAGLSAGDLWNNAGVVNIV
jgi:hypothetical protein